MRHPIYHLAAFAPAVAIVPLLVWLRTMSQAPWEKSPPEKKTGKTKLSARNIAWARARAKKAGRRYPNLVDNMAASRRQTEQEHKATADDPAFMRQVHARK